MARVQRINNGVESNWTTIHEAKGEKEVLRKYFEKLRGGLWKKGYRLMMSSKNEFAAVNSQRTWIFRLVG